LAWAKSPLLLLLPQLVCWESCAAAAAAAAAAANTGFGLVYVLLLLLPLLVDWEYWELRLCGCCCYCCLCSFLYSWRDTLWANEVYYLPPFHLQVTEVLMDVSDAEGMARVIEMVSGGRGY
jgi:hypothetical protein